MSTATKRSILVMDDSAIVLDTLRLFFEASGYTVRTALNLSELEARCAEAPVDMFVLDVQMPEIFGDDVAQVLREVRKTKAPVILFSGLEESALASRAREAEVDGYVSKSAGVGALVERVEAILRGTSAAGS